MLELNNSEEVLGKPIRKNPELRNLRILISRILYRKYLFLVLLSIALAMAYLYNRLTIPVYRITASLLIEENRNSNSTGNEQLLEGFGLMPGSKNLDNQMLVLTSRSLVNKTLDELDFSIGFFRRTNFGLVPVYPERPLEVIYSGDLSKVEDVGFRFRYKGENMFIVDAESQGVFKLHSEAYFGDTLRLPGCSLVIHAADMQWLNNKGNRKLYFTLHSRRELVSDYLKRLSIEQGSRKGSIIKISIKGKNKEKDLAFLERYTGIFVNMSLDKKNSEANRTIRFIDEQLVGISDSLLITENKLQRFRSQNRIMNLSAQGQAIIDQAMNLEIEKGRLELESNYYSYLSGYLSNDTLSDVPVAPATMGITDPGLTRLVGDITELQSQMYSTALGDRNPMQGIYSQKLQKTKDALSETLKGLMSANDLAKKENLAQIQRINQRAEALPVTERALLGIERKYKLNDQLYTFLLEKRAVAQMQKASNVADNEIVDYPDYEKVPVRPNKAFSYFLGILAGFGFPFLWIFISGIFDTRVTNPEEINQLSDVPVAGYIPHFSQSMYRILIDEPESVGSESFRLLRSRMKYYTKETLSPVILITSSMPEEGKTFTAINLASAYCLTGRKTVLVEFDLRQPAIFHQFEINNEEGISTWLTGKSDINRIIRNTDFDNFQIIPCGPLPANPAELTESDKTAELFKLLRDRYEYIIVDTPPVGIVSDTYQLLNYADVCLLVIRERFSYREIIAKSIQELSEGGARSLSLVMNDVSGHSGAYGYNSRYHYGYRDKKNHSKVKVTAAGIKVGSSISG